MSLIWYACTFTVLIHPAIFSFITVCIWKYFRQLWQEWVHFDNFLLAVGFLSSTWSKDRERSSLLRAQSGLIPEWWSGLLLCSLGWFFFMLNGSERPQVISAIFASFRGFSHFFQNFVPLFYPVAMPLMWLVCCLEPRCFQELAEGSWESVLAPVPV